MKAERGFLQARVKSINSLLGYDAKQRVLCRSKLASIISNTSMKKHQELIDKVREFRHFKVKQRQINKFNRLIEKEGNITWSGTQVGSTFPQAARVNSSQAGSAHLMQLVLPRQLVSVSPKQVALLSKLTFPKQAVFIPSQG